MSTWTKQLLKGSAATVAALWLVATPYAASAQWWEAEEAYGETEEGFADYGYYDNYGYGTGEGLAEDETGYGYDYDDEVSLGGDEEEGFGEEEGGLFGGEEGVEEGGYYTENFEDEEEYDGWF